VAEFVSENVGLCEFAGSPKAALEFVVIESVRKLVFGAAELSQLRSTTPAEWKKRVTTRAVPGNN